MAQVAFFPWVQLEEEVEVGGFRILSYERGARPGQSAEEQALIDEVLSPYRTTGGAEISRAVILAPTDRALLADLSEEQHAQAFLLAELMAFAALSAREYFTQLGNYTNRDQLRLVIQSFTDHPRGTALFSRRRDGHTRSGISADAYQERCATHVHPGEVRMDWDLVEALLGATEDPDWTRAYQAIVLFNEANTDRLQMPEEAEVTLSYAALEQFLGIPGAAEREVVEAFEAAIGPKRALPPDEWRIPEDNPRAAGLLGRAQSLRGAWVADFRNCRGSVAHGHSSEAYPSRWSVREHLLFAAFILPVVLKCNLSRTVHYELQEDDRLRMDVFELLLNEEHFAVRDPSDHSEHPWRQIVFRQRWAPNIEAITEALLAEEEEGDGTC